MSALVVRYHTDDGHITGLLIDKGRKYLRFIPMKAKCIRVHRLLVAEEKYMTELDTPLKKAAKQFRAAGRRFGITTAAKLALRGL